MTSRGVVSAHGFPSIHQGVSTYARLSSKQHEGLCLVCARHLAGCTLRVFLTTAGVEVRSFEPNSAHVCVERFASLQPRYRPLRIKSGDAIHAELLTRGANISLWHRSHEAASASLDVKLGGALPLCGSAGSRDDDQRKDRSYPPLECDPQVYSSLRVPDRQRWPAS